MSSSGGVEVHQSRRSSEAVSLYATDGDIDEALAIVRENLVEILTENQLRLVFEDVYRQCYKLSRNHQSERLYSLIHDVIGKHLKSETYPKVVESMLSRSIDFLRTLNKVWKNYSTAMIMICDLTKYMNRVYCGEKGIQDVHDMGYTLFRKEIIQDEGIGEHIRCTILNLVELDRNNPLPLPPAIADDDTTEMKKVCQMLIDLGVEQDLSFYQINFETKFLEQSLIFHKQKFEKLLRECWGKPTQEYTRKIELLIREEEERVINCLDVQSTQEKIVELLTLHSSVNENQVKFY